MWKNIGRNFLIFYWGVHGFVRCSNEHRISTERPLVSEAAGAGSREESLRIEVKGDTFIYSRLTPNVFYSAAKSSTRGSRKAWEGMKMKETLMCSQSS